MTHDERLSDTVSKWERLSRSGAVRDLKLVFKVSALLSLLYVIIFGQFFASEVEKHTIGKL